MYVIRQTADEEVGHWITEEMLPGPVVDPLTQLLSVGRKHQLKYGLRLNGPYEGIDEITPPILLSDGTIIPGRTPRNSVPSQNRIGGSRTLGGTLTRSRNSLTPAWSDGGWGSVTRRKQAGQRRLAAQSFSSAAPSCSLRYFRTSCNLSRLSPTGKGECGNVPNEPLPALTTEGHKPDGLKTSADCQAVRRRAGHRPQGHKQPRSREDRRRPACKAGPKAIIRIILLLKIM